MTERPPDPIRSFYDRHPYPPPVADLGTAVARLGELDARRHAHHLIWPHRPLGSTRAVLVAGCGTAQAVRHAIRHPAARVIGIDVSPTSVEHTRALAARHGVTNLAVEQLAIEDVDALGMRFDHVVCTGVLHHLADPALGLRALRGVLQPGGAITSMVYAPYGRAGIYMIQEYCRRLGLTASSDDVAGLVASLREIPDAHPVARLLRDSPDFRDPDALADALLNPRDRAYSVPELFELIERADLRFGRWERQAPYMAECGSISETPHATRLALLPFAERSAAIELFRGTMTRHTTISYAAGDLTSGVVDPASADLDEWIPVRAPTAIAVEERLPRGAAAALINRAHTDTDLVLFVDRSELRTFRSIDGRRTIGQMGRDAAALMQRLWRHDLVAFDASGGAAPS